MSVRIKKYVADQVDKVGPCLEISESNIMRPHYDIVRHNVGSATFALLDTISSSHSANQATGSVKSIE